MQRLQKAYIAAGSFAVLATPFLAAAQTDKVSPVLANVLNAVKILVAIVFVIALLVFAWGIVKLIIAAGDPGKIAEAKGFIIWGVLGIAILASVYGLIGWLQSYFGVGGGGGQIPIPGVPSTAP